ncbi:hypothetical protein [Brevundimonas sp.]|uniref:hypothetical protein n=1 Tax=Brevundimonas sp. TaxID=1871086 RepID=UPI002ED84C7F
MNATDPGPDVAAASAVDLQSIQHWRKLFTLAGLFTLLAWTPLVKAQPVLEHPVELLGPIAILLAALSLLTGVAVRLAAAEDDAARAASTLRLLPVSPRSLKLEFRHV